MPPRLPAGRVLGAFLIAASLLLTDAPAPALALDPPRPLPGYRPTFVTEREPGPWEDCTWAASAMLLDKWTNGLAIVDRERLRTLSGDLEGGSNLADVTRAFARLGIALKTSPLGGDSITWPELLRRLAHGGGAILLGDYSELPRVHGRWDPAFWENEGLLDDHALYLDRYDPRRGRVLVMDPLAPPGWTGEWIRVSALKRYAWRTPGGALWTAMTPAAQAAPFDGVDLGDPTVTADASAIRVSWPIEQTPKGWAFAGAGVTTQFDRVADIDLTDEIVTALPVDGPAIAPPVYEPAIAPPALPAEEPAVALPALPALPAEEPAVALPALPALPAEEPGSPPTSAEPGPTPTSAEPGPTAPVATVADGSLTATIPLPSPGTYRVSVELTDQRLGRQVVTAGPFNLYVPGRRAARYVAPDYLLVSPGALSRLWLVVANAGVESWADPVLVPWLPLDLQRPLNTRLVGTWLPQPPTGDEDRGVTQVPPPIDFGLLPLDPGGVQLIDAAIPVPIDPGYWRLIVDVVDDGTGSVARLGSAPGVVVVEVLAPGQDARDR